MRRMLLLACFCLALCPLLIGQQIEVDTAGGHALFIKKGCNECHSIWRVGGQVGPDLGRSSASSDVFDLAGRFWNHSSQMMEVVERRGSGWPTFTNEQMAGLMSYLYTLNLLEEPGEPERGRLLLDEKRCSACHRLGGAGGASAAPLDEYASFTNVIPLAEGMWNAGEAMRGAQRSGGKGIPQFTGRDMADIQAAIRKFGGGKSSPHYLPLPSIERGKRLYAEKACNRCHGTRGTGGSGGPSLVERERSRGLSQMTGALWNHSYEMVEQMRSMGIRRPDFKTGEMADILAYLYFEGFLGQPGDPAAGQQLFAKRGCATCHTESRTQSQVGPSLSTLAQADNPVPLISAMWNHSPAMREWMKEQAIPWPTFQRDDLRHIWAYLRKTAGDKGAK